MKLPKKLTRLDEHERQCTAAVLGSLFALETKPHSLPCVFLECYVTLRYVYCTVNSKNTRYVYCTVNSKNTCHHMYCIR